MHTLTSVYSHCLPRESIHVYTCKLYIYKKEKREIRIQKPWQEIDLAIATDLFNLLNLDFIGIPWHSLHKPFSKVVEGNGDLHFLVLGIAITVAQEHDLVMVSEEIVGDCYGCGTMNRIDQPITATR